MTDNHEDHPYYKTIPLLASIGDVAARWARLEYQINRVIWALASLSDDDGSCITSQITPLVPRMRALIALAHKNGCSDTLLAGLNRFSATAEKIGRKRNRVIHDPWYVSDTNDQKYGRLEVSADRKLVFGVQEQSPKKNMDISREIIEAEKQFFELRDQLVAETDEQTKARLLERFAPDRDMFPE